MGIVSFNIEGASFNHAYVNSELSKIAQVLCLQEHWLHKFEQKELSQLLPEWHQHIRCYGEANPVQNTHRPAGRGGVATLWTPNLDKYARRLDEEGNERILVTLFDMASNPLCVINCYLPSGTAHEAVNKFKDDLDALHELCMKYGQTHNILILGDLNQDHYHRSGEKERRMTRLIQEQTLVDLGEQDQVPTYINPYLGHSSRIDHILYKPHPTHPLQTSKSTVPETDSSTNTSKHLPIMTTLTIGNIISKKQAKASRLKKRNKFKFDEADITLFGETMTQELTEYNIEIMNPHEAIITLQHMLDTATFASVPYVKVGPRPPTSKPKKWTPELSRAVENAKRRKYLWNQAGEPRDNHPTWINKKQATKQVRSVQRKQRAEDRRLTKQEASVASAIDQTLMHKIIRNQRADENCASVLMVNGVWITDDAGF
jgi:endonuclease/exonuclease/phosphatase family metal-dependent hydrolase